MPVIMTDSNGHTSMDDHGRRLGGREFDGHRRADRGKLMAIGEYGMEVESRNRKRLLEFCERHDLYAVNTHWRDASGHTYVEFDGTQTRVDYVLLPMVTAPLVSSCDLRRDLYRFLYLGNRMDPIDHTPIQVGISRRKLHLAPRPQDRFDHKAITRAMVQRDSAASVKLAKTMDETVETRRLLQLPEEADGPTVVAAYEDFHYKLLEVVREQFPAGSRKTSHDVKVQVAAMIKDRARERVKQTQLDILETDQSPSRVTLQLVQEISGAVPDRAQMTGEERMELYRKRLGMVVTIRS